VCRAFTPFYALTLTSAKAKVYRVEDRIRVVGNRDDPSGGLLHILDTIRLRESGVGPDSHGYRESEVRD
jgi:hypothetical protein